MLLSIYMYFYANSLVNIWINTTDRSSVSQAVANPFPDLPPKVISRATNENNITRVRKLCVLTQAVNEVWTARAFLGEAILRTI